MEKIKVLHVFQRMRTGGAETLIMNIFRKMDHERIQFDFLCMSNEPGEYDDEIKENGGNIFIIDSPKECGAIKHILQIIKVIKSNNGYDIIHVPTMFHSGIVCFAAFLAGVKVRIVHSHNASEFNRNTIKRRIYRTLSRLMIALFCTDKIACGYKARDYLFGNSKKIQRETMILYNGIDLHKYKFIDIDLVSELKKEFDISDEIIIGNVARFEEQKNHIFFIRFAQYLKDKKIPAKIILVGDGKLKQEIEAQVKKNRLESYINFAGVRTNIPEFMNLFDVYIMPSLYEGFPLTVVEALASGTNCVLSDTISKEVSIIDDAVKFVGLDDDLSKWYNAVITCNNKKTDRNKYIEILKEKGFSSEYTTNKLVNFYLKKGSEIYEKK
ncbi:glycosyltransferase [Thomasclavelia sp.]|uniref:glycosyltransferase n=1 Tax=Thomasclavelia sp. TaxID=3025757 RepID=UPI0025FD78D2|nr:glycosyltransferase [Thomasclavelia sp.]